MQEIPMPHVLDPDRVAALDRSCEYAQHLWRDLNAARAYLVASLPPGSPSGTDDVAMTCAAPRGVGDTDGWARWADAYAAITSVLAGPHGDSGFGRQEAVQEAQRRGVSV